MMNTTTINYDEMIMENMGLVYMIFNKYYKINVYVDFLYGEFNGKEKTQNFLGFIHLFH